LISSRRPSAHQEKEPLNEYEKAFVERIDRLNLDGPTFALLVNEALEAEYGGEVDNLTKDFDQATLESPERFAEGMFEMLGTDAMQYYSTIIKYAESDRFQPEEESEQAEEESELGSILRDIQPDQGEGTDPQAGQS